jgi:hypothetical protein
MRFERIFQAVTAALRITEMPTATNLECDGPTAAVTAKPVENSNAGT